MKQVLLFFTLMIMAFPATAHAEGAYKRIKESGTLRCGYFLVPPEFDKDPNTGKLSGIGYDVTEAAAKLLSLEVDWVEEVRFDDLTAGLQSGRYDAICSSVFNNSALAREASFTIPFMYTPVGVFVRTDDSRFDKGLQAINDPAIKVSTLDGEPTSRAIVRTDFPQAEIVSIPSNSGVAMMLTNVVQRKADVAFTYWANFYRYNKNNPDMLKPLRADAPIRAFGNTIMLPQGEEKLKNMLDTSLSELMNSGRVDAIISKHELFPNSYYRVQQPYKVPE